MSLQILGLREYYDKSKDKVRKAEKFFEKGWRANSAQEILNDPSSFLELIPPEERYNMFFTVAHCIEESGRKLERQDYLFFDIDDINKEKIQQYPAVLSKALEVKQDETGFLFTGNGLHVLVGLISPITSTEYFQENKLYYRAICQKINKHMGFAGLEGEADPQPFAGGYMVRLPGTVNKKKGKEQEEVKIIQGNIVPIDYDIKSIAGLPEVEITDQIADSALKKMGTVDSEGILDGCDFLKYCHDNQEKVKEPAWYAMLSITARLKDGIKVSHEYSCKHPSYDEGETDSKIEQALKASGPRTCKNINEIWGKCLNCPQFTKELTSPIMIRSENYIATKDTGFHEVKMNKFGNQVAGSPVYEDLRRYFELEYRYVTMADSGIVHIYDDFYWREFARNKVLNFAQEKFIPTATSKKRCEFLDLVRCTNLRDDSWFSVPGKINFNNGILDLRTSELITHNPEFGFRYKLDFDYEPDKECPRFMQFMEEITCGHKELELILMEFMAYCLSGLDPSWGEKALILIGEGSNGKSVFMDVLRSLVGDDTYSSLTLEEMKDKTNRYQLDGKLFNLAEETPTKSMLESSLFKNLVTGGETMVKKLYSQPYRIKNMCKLMMACNDLPPTMDVSRGMFRRLLIVPFNAVFEGVSIDKGIRKKLRAERSGIINEIIKAYARLMEQGSFTESKIVSGEIDAYKTDNDTVLSWFMDNVELGNNMENEITIGKLYADYKFTMEQSRMKFEPENNFFKRIRRIVVDKSRFIRRRVNGRRVTLIKGLVLGETQSGF